MFLVRVVGTGYWFVTDIGRILNVVVFHLESHVLALGSGSNPLLLRLHQSKPRQSEHFSTWNNVPLKNRRKKRGLIFQDRT